MEIQLEIEIEPESPLSVRPARYHGTPELR